MNDMLSVWKSCGNCADIPCAKKQEDERCLDDWFAYCDDWHPLHCPFCGGTLSGLRRSQGHFIRHCYNCHFEFPIDKDGNPRRASDEKERQNV